MRSSQSRLRANFDLQDERHPVVPHRQSVPGEARNFWLERLTWVPATRKPLRGVSEVLEKPPKARRRKRAADIALGAALIVFFAPLMAAIALAVCLDGGPALYGHSRVGPDGRRFRCWKFRTMVANADKVLSEVLARNAAMQAEWENSFKLRDDPRITRVGRVLRAFSLDELPQLFNVMCGDMSLVGPRPIVEAEIDRYGSRFNAYCACRPGITGLWQVHGRSDVSYSRRVDLDTQYARTWSLWLDLQILASTVVVVVRRDGAY
jgi:Undecaprenyl-phosphate galactose phosphotransferase WbaP